KFVACSSHPEPRIRSVGHRMIFPDSSHRSYRRSPAVFRFRLPGFAKSGRAGKTDTPPTGHRPKNSTNLRRYRQGTAQTARTVCRSEPVLHGVVLRSRRFACRPGWVAEKKRPEVLLSGAPDWDRIYGTHRPFRAPPRDRTSR